MVTNDQDDEPEGLSTLIIQLGPVLTGHEVGTVITALLYVIADCAVQGEVPKAELLAGVHESLNKLYDEGNSNGRSPYH